MKEFEKWLKGKAGIGWYTGAEEGWKAALGWVLDNFDGKTDILTLGLNIREELEE